MQRRRSIPLTFACIKFRVDERRSIRAKNRIFIGMKPFLSRKNTSRPGSMPALGGFWLLRKLKLLLRHEAPCAIGGGRATLWMPAGRSRRRLRCPCVGEIVEAEPVNAGERLAA